jgi:hypothetical protein
MERSGGGIGRRLQGDIAQPSEVGQILARFNPSSSLTSLHSQRGKFYGTLLPLHTCADVVDLRERPRGVQVKISDIPKSFSLDNYQYKHMPFVLPLIMCGGGTEGLIQLQIWNIKLLSKKSTRKERHTAEPSMSKS